MDKHIIDLYNQALKDYDEAIQKLDCYKQSIKRIKALAIHLKGRCGQVIPSEIKEIIQECEVDQ